ncbi:alpha/beta hydrolase [Nocardia sp. NPDC047648]|uniref:alpha/beta hydrolase n=1 Tax=Nocardia sp. NPDC047648 TaxID=3155625 RepID=UPI0033F8E9EA
MTSPATDLSSRWTPDILGTGYSQLSLDLGTDPDGEGRIQAVVVRRDAQPADDVAGAVLYLHGFSDYFFQTDLADHFAQSGLAFYALELRKCGRARRSGHTAHYVSDLAYYDDELERTIGLINEEHSGLPIYVVAHSTGGLVSALWLDRRRRENRPGTVAGLILNSPWLDLHGSAVMRGPVTWALRALAKVRPMRRMDLPASTTYSDSLHAQAKGEWSYDLQLKPAGGFPVTVGWLNAIRRGHARLHRGLDIGVPALVLHSDKTHYSRAYNDKADRADTILDVNQISQWASCLGIRTTVVPIEDARHDVFLSLPEIRYRAYAHVQAWLVEQSAGAIRHRPSHLTARSDVTTGSAPVSGQSQP